MRGDFLCLRSWASKWKLRRREARSPSFFFQ
jgi:hypothetical protein